MNSQTLKRIILVGLFIVPFVPFLVSSSFFFPFVVTKAFAWRIIIEIVFASWVLLALTNEEYRPKKSLILYAIMAFLLVIGLADVFGVDPVKSFWSNFERMEGYIAMLHLGMFFLVISSVFKELDWKKWWNTTLVASFIMGLYSLFQVLGVISPNQGGARVDGTFGNTIYLAVYMLFHIFIALLFMWREWKNVNLRWMYGLLIVFQLFILYHTATRGAILGLIGGLLVVAFLNLFNKDEEARTVKKLSTGLLVGILVLVGGFFLAKDSSFVNNNPVLARFASLTTEEIKSQGRYFIWPMAVDGFKERPILGWGQGNFNYVFQEYYRPEMYILEPWFDRAHNIFLDWMVSGGILGLLAYLSLYLSLLYIIWWKDSLLTHAEKSILTGLLAGYFFHNFFVFDHLVSYVLFFSLLGYIHSRREGEVLWKHSVSQEKVNVIALPVVTLAMISMVYFVNIRPIFANLNLIDALQNLQTGAFEPKVASNNFRQAYSGTVLGREEILEHMALNTTAILSSDLMSVEEKNDYFAFVTQASIDEASRKSDDARIQLVVGSFLSSTSASMNEAFKYLNRAKELMPNKQQVYFELGSAYINADRPADALEAFKYAYELAPDYNEAKVIYLIGAIYAGDRALENSLLDKLSPEVIANDKRVVSAYLNLASMNIKAGRQAQAIALLQRASQIVPAYKEQVDKFIIQIQNGEIK